MKVKVLALVAAAAALQACASAEVEKRVDEKLAHENDIKTTVELRQEIDGVLANAPGLSDDQRTKLKSLSVDTRAKMDRYREDSLKLRALLVKDLVAEHYDRKEVGVIKNRIRDLEEKRVSLIFSAAGDVNHILGNWGDERSRAKFYRVMDYTTPLYYGR